MHILDVLVAALVLANTYTATRASTHAKAAKDRAEGAESASQSAEAASIATLENALDQNGETKHLV